jgi:hypothetical protein
MNRVGAAGVEALLGNLGILTRWLKLTLKMQLLIGKYQKLLLNHILF